MALMFLLRALPVTADRSENAALLGSDSSVPTTSRREQQTVDLVPSYFHSHLRNKGEAKRARELSCTTSKGLMA